MRLVMPLFFSEQALASSYPMSAQTRRGTIEPGLMLLCWVSWTDYSYYGLKLHLSLTALNHTWPIYLIFSVTLLLDLQAMLPEPS